MSAARTRGQRQLCMVGVRPLLKTALKKLQYLIMMDEGESREKLRLRR